MTRLTSGSFSPITQSCLIIHLSFFLTSLMSSDWFTDQSLAREYRYRHVLFYGSTCWLVGCISPPNSSFEWKHFPVSMVYVDPACPSCHHWHTCHQNFVQNDNAHITITLPTGWIVLLFMTMASNYITRIRLTRPFHHLCFSPAYDW
jgi:hypothetical protein